MKRRSGDPWRRDKLYTSVYFSIAVIFAMVAPYLLASIISQKNSYGFLALMAAIGLSLLPMLFVWVLFVVDYRNVPHIWNKGDSVGRFILDTLIFLLFNGIFIFGFYQSFVSITLKVWGDLFGSY